MAMAEPSDPLGFPGATTLGPTNRGANFFAGGPSNISSSASQTINEAADAMQIDTGRVTVDLAGYLGGFRTQRDNAILTATFLNGSTGVLGSISLGPVSNTDRNNLTSLLLRSTTGVVPIGTRSITVDLQLTRLDGDYNDGYADNLSLVLHSNAVPEPSSLILTGFGVLGLVVTGRRRLTTQI